MNIRMKNVCVQLSGLYKRREMAERVQLTVTMAGSLLLTLLTLLTLLISALSAHSFPQIFPSRPPPDREQHDKTVDFPSHTSIWTLWDIVSSTGSVIGNVRSMRTPEEYQYQYHVGEKGETGFMSRDENMHDNVVTGSYSYVDPYGTLVTVEYIADDQGYRETRKQQPGFAQLVK